VEHAPASAEPVPFRPRSLEVAGWTIHALSDGWLRLDGGGMWGVVPKALWRRWTPPDPDNTIPIALRPFLAVRGEHVVVVEAGLGRRWDAKLAELYRMLPTDSLAETLGAYGVAPEDVTHVVASHCHWDHVGAWLVERGGRLAPLFPNARHLAPAVEIEIARRPGHARAASYRAEDVEPLLAEGLLEGYGSGEGRGVELLPGLTAHVLGGHSDGVAVLALGRPGRDPDDPQQALFWSDVVPTTHHAQPPYIMAYDLDVVRSFEQRSEWLARAARLGWVGLFYHDVDHAFARLARDGRRYAVEPV
jgi:glyoxylase-like metal-dependent hydrolase (beta-lactamase superfamily II)